MTAVKKRTFSLSTEQSEFVDRKVATGNYASSSEVIREGLRALQERDAVMEKWLRDEVVPTIAAYDADPGRAISPSQLRANIRSWYDEARKDATE